MGKVAIASCENYERARVDEALEDCLLRLGGISRFVSKGDRVVLKINLLRAARPDEVVTTHPSFLTGMVRQVQKAGGTPIIADSPGGAFNENALRKAYEICEYDKVAKETGAELNFDTRYETVDLPKGIGVKKINIAKYALDADKMITLPKLKTHMLTHFTGACKVEFGLVPGRDKMVFHGKLPTASMFSKMLVDIVERFPPALSVMDGIVGMEGLGPGNGKPRRVGVILASTSPVALDVVAMAIVNMDARSTPVIAEAHSRGLSDTDISEINIVGKSVEEVFVKDFKTAAGTSRLSAIAQAVGKFAARKPVVNAKCIGCGICKQNCPKSRIALVPQGENSGKKVAKIEHEGCIKCYCCHELCPHDAIDLKRF